MIYVIIPFSRPNLIDSIIFNFHNQIYNEKKLIIVENGLAKGTCKKRNIQPDVLLSSDNHQSYAKNEAINWIKKHGGGWWTTFDDDDYYGEGYLTKVVNSLHKAEMIGQLDIFVKTISNRLRLFSNLGRNTYTNAIHGSTITARAEDCPYFENTGKWGEDHNFVQRYINQGAKCWATSPYYHLLNRHNKNTWQVSDDSMVRRMVYSSNNKCIIKDFGNKINYEIIDGLILSTMYSRVYPDKDISLEEDSLAYKELLKVSLSSDELAKKWAIKNL